MNMATRKVILTPELVKELNVLGEMYWRWSVLPADSSDDLVWQSSGSPLSHLSECIIGLLAESAPEGTDDALYFAGCVMQTFTDCRPDSTMSQCRDMVVTEHAEQRAYDAAELCDECGQPMPGELVSDSHAASCSLHPANIVPGV